MSSRLYRQNWISLHQARASKTPVFTPSRAIVSHACISGAQKAQLAGRNVAPGATSLVLTKEKLQFGHSSRLARKAWPSIRRRDQPAGWPKKLSGWLSQGTHTHTCGAQLVMIQCSLQLLDKYLAKLQHHTHTHTRAKSGTVTERIL